MSDASSVTRTPFVGLFRFLRQTKTKEMMADIATIPPTIEPTIAAVFVDEEEPVTAGLALNVTVWLAAPVNAKLDKALSDEVGSGTSLLHIRASHQKV